MLSYDWIVLVTLGLDRWDTPRRPRTTYEIEREEAWQATAEHQTALRQVRRKALLLPLRTLIARMFTRRSHVRHLRARPRTPASRV